MSIMFSNGLKAELPRTGPDEFWQIVHDGYARRNRRRWKYLAMLALRESLHWPMEFIALAFDHPRGHIVRCLQQVKDELREKFRTNPLIAEGFELAVDVDDRDHVSNAA